MLKFEVEVIDPRNGKVITKIYSVTEGQFVPSGYRGTEFIRNSGFQVGSKTLLGTIDGFLSYEEEREWEALLS